MEKELKEFGLSEKEIKVYLACLYLGSSSVHRISEKAGLIRTSTYDILKSLVKKGFVSYVIKDKKKYFEAAGPEVFLAVLDERKSKIEKILPQLNEMKKSAIEKPKIEIYEGVEGIKTVYEDILKYKKTLAAISSTSKLYIRLQHYVEQFMIRRTKAGIGIRLLTEKSKLTKKTMAQRDLAQKRTTKYISGLQNIPITQYIYGNKVAIISSGDKEPMGFIIENEAFAKEQLLLFNLLWKNQVKE